VKQGGFPLAHFDAKVGKPVGAKIPIEFDAKHKQARMACSPLLFFRIDSGISELGIQEGEHLHLCGREKKNLN
jgi:hypothetical protein